MAAGLKDTIEQLSRSGEPYVVATVVRAERPTSAKPGAKAVIDADGRVTGWVGGSCTEPVVKRQARLALAEGEPRLLRLCAPEMLGQAPQQGVIEEALTCVSGGTLEIYLEPQHSEPHLIVIGHQAVAEALATIGKAAGFAVTVLGFGATPQQFPEADQLIGELAYDRLDLTRQSWVVVASHGNYDEEALERALESEAAYVALVASPKRAAEVRAYLSKAGLPDQALAQLRSPAGIDLGGHTPGEIAVSVVAEILQERNRARRAAEAAGAEQSGQGITASGVDQAASAGSATGETAGVQNDYAVDPVCGMMVEIAGATLISTHDGMRYYFCSAGCKQRFEEHPEKFLAER